MNRLAIPLWLLAGLAVTMFLRVTREVFVPVALAMLAAYAVYPLVRLLERARLPRVVSAALVVAGLVGIVGAGGWSLRDEFSASVRRLPEQIREIRNRVEGSTEGGLLSRLREAARELQGSTQVLTGPAPAPAPASAASPPLANYLWQNSTDLITVAGQVTVFVFLLYFLLLGAETWRTRLVKLSGDLLSSRRTGVEVLDEINWQVRRFILVRLVTAAIVAVATWLMLLAFGAPAPMFWGVAAGLLNSVPYFGPLIVSSALAIVGFVAGGLPMAGKLSGAALLITTIEGWLITPPLLGRAARLNTLAVLLSLMFWSWVWGIWGTILAIPLTAIAKAVGDHVERLQWISTLIGDEQEQAARAARQ